jgi:formate-dependent nitrite reductase membrane component NrfD
MFLILLAGLNALVFTLVEHRHALVLGEDDQATKFMKVSAGLSLSFWLLVLLLGRLLPAFEGSTSFF